MYFSPGTTEWCLFVSVTSISNEESTSESQGNKVSSMFSFLGDSIGCSVVIITKFSSGSKKVEE